MTEVRSDTWSIVHDEATNTLTYRGILRYSKLSAADIQAIDGLYGRALANAPARITLHTVALDFIDDLGFEGLLKIAVQTRKSGLCHLAVIGSRNSPWQTQKLPELKKYANSFELSLVG